MQYNTLGNSGLKVSRVGLGCNNFGGRIDLDATKAVVSKALDLGITLFDTADIYGNRGGSEEQLGKALGEKRKDVVVATKFAGPMGEGELMKGASRRYIFNAVEASLERLGTDYIDLYQIHFPDQETPIAETLEALDDLVRSGKVRYIGCSNFSGWQLVESRWVSKTRGYASFVSAQNHYNLLDRRVERELVPACRKYGVGVLPYFPLASGLLTGKYKRGEPPAADTRLANFGPRAERALSDENFDIVERLEGFAKDRNRSLLELAIGWLASQPTVSSVIAGATRPDQVEQNAAAGEWELSAEEIDEVGKLSKR